MSRITAKWGDQCHLCSMCGEIEKSPYDCPQGGEFDDEMEGEGVVGNNLEWHGYCDKSDEWILLCRDMDSLDASNAAAFLTEWAEENGHNLSIEWANINDRDVIVWYSDQGEIVLGQHYSSAFKKLNNLLKA
jgi:hypothetical protein